MKRQNLILRYNFTLFIICVSLLFSCRNNENEMLQTSQSVEKHKQSGVEDMEPKKFRSYKINKGSFWRKLNNDPAIGPVLRREMRLILQNEVANNRKKRSNGYPYLSLSDLEKSILDKWKDYLSPQQFDIVIDYYKKIQ